MSTSATTELIQSIVTLLTEAYAGPPDWRSTWFIDNEPNSGILGILEGVSAEEASRSVHNKDGEAGSTIAANVEHLRWSLANANAELRGENFGKWSESWKVTGADAVEWDRLRQALRSEFETLREAIQKQPELSGDYLTGVLALLPHAAYHLGTIRQMIERVREKA